MSKIACYENPFMVNGHDQRTGLKASLRVIVTDKVIGTRKARNGENPTKFYDPFVGKS